MAEEVRDSGWALKLFRWFGNDTKPRSADDEFNDDDDTLAAGASHRLEFLNKQLTLETDRKKRYDRYDDMDETDLPSTVLDLYAEDATQINWETGKSVWVECPTNPKMEEAASEMFKRLRIEDEIGGIARDMCKYGDNFERTVYAVGKGVMSLSNQYAKEIDRVENERKQLQGFKQSGKKYKGKQQTEVSYPWDYIHFRLRGKHRMGPYGTSILSGAYRPWRQLQMAENHQLYYRINRHPDRRAFLIDTGTQDEVESARTVSRFRRKWTQSSFVDPVRGITDYKRNPLTPLEDYFMGIKNGSSTRIETLSGSSNGPEIADIQFYLNKFFSSTRVPKAFAGFEGEINGKATLSNQDMRFARGVKRVQRGVLQGLRTLCEFNYMLLSGENPENTDFDFRKHEFHVHMTPSSFLEEMERLELIQLRMGIVEGLMAVGQDNESINKAQWVTHVLRKYMRMPEQEINRLVKGAASGGYEDEGDQEFEDVNLDRKATETEEQILERLIEDNPRLQRLILKGQDLLEPIHVDRSDFQNLENLTIESDSHPEERE